MEFGVRHYPQLEIDLDKLEDNLRALKAGWTPAGSGWPVWSRGFNGLPRQPGSMKSGVFQHRLPPVWSSCITCG